MLAHTRIGYRSLKAAGFDGHCEIVRPGVINGWAWKVGEPDTNVDVALFVDSEFLLRVPCLKERDDLKAANIGDGCHGFEVALPKALRTGAQHTLNVVIADTGMELKSGRLALIGNALRIL